MKLLDEDEPAEPAKYQKKSRRKTQKRCFVTANLTNCKYDLVRASIASSGMSVLKEDSSALNAAFLFWYDSVVPMERFQMLKDYQRINHFPSMGEVCRKDLLARNMAKMKRARPHEFNFTPKTWNMPTEYNLMLLHAKDALKNQRKPLTYIQKPSNGAMGNGIQLFRNPEKIHPSDHTVVQEYLDKPLLLDGFKFDLRLYVLVTSCDPLQVFLYQDGLVRLGTEKYSHPTESNVSQLYMHLTNYSVNKQNDKFERHNDFDRGSKRSVKSLMNKLKNAGYDVITLWQSITELIIKTMLVAAPHLLHSYKMCRPGQSSLSDSVCFEILGFDIFVDKKLKPWLLEVNRAPSFGGDEAIDQEIKGGVIRDAIRLVNIRASDKRRNLANQRAATQRRLFTPIQRKRTPPDTSPTSKRKLLVNRRKEDLKKQLIWARRQAAKEEFQNANLRGYRRIYPCHDKSQRDKYAKLSDDVFKLFHSQCALHQRNDHYHPRNVDKLLDMIEQCEAEEGVVPRALQPLCSMPALTPPSSSSSSRRLHSRGFPFSDTSSSDTSSSSEEEEGTSELSRRLQRRKNMASRTGGRASLARSSMRVNSSTMGNGDRRDWASLSAVISPRPIAPSNGANQMRRPPATPNSIEDREIERTEQTLSALERTRIKFPGKTDEEADVILDNIMKNWKHHKPLLATYWLVKLDSSKRKKVVDIVRGNVSAIMRRVWRGWKIDSLRLMRFFNRVFNRMHWSRGQGLWSCFTTSYNSWETIFSKSTDVISPMELECCRKVVRLCKDCLLIVYQFANDVTVRMGGPRSTQKERYPPPTDNNALMQHLPLRFSRALHTSQRGAPGHRSMVWSSIN